MMILGGFGLGVILILALVVLIVANPKKSSKDLALAKKNFQEALEEARNFRAHGDYSDAAERLEEAVKFGNIYAEFTDPLPEEFAEVLKQAQVEKENIDSFISASKSNKTDDLVSLLENITKKEPYLQGAVAKLLAQSKHPKALKGLDAMIQDLTNQHQRLDAITALGEYRQTPHADEAVHILSSGLRKSINAVERLKRGGDILLRSIPKMIQTIAKFRTPQAAEALGQLIEYSETGKYLLLAVKGLKSFGNTTAIPYLIKALNKQTEEIRAAAKRGLVQLNNYAVKPLQDLIIESRKAATPVDAIESLIAIYKDTSSPSVIRAFRKILGRATAEKRWDLAFYCLTNLIKIDNLSPALRESMKSCVREMCKGGANQIDKVYYKRLLTVATYLRMDKEQAFLLSLVGKTTRMKSVPRPQSAGKFRPGSGLVQIRNESYEKIIFVIKTENFSRTLTIPSRKIGRVEINQSSLYDIFAVKGRHHYQGSYVFDLGKSYRITFR